MPVGSLQKQNDTRHHEFEDAWFDPSKKAKKTLEDILSEETPDEIIDRSLRYVGVEEDLKGQKVLSGQTSRVASRVLFITRKKAYLEKESREMSLLVGASELFDEIHIMVFVGPEIKDRPRRIAKNIWVYPVRIRYWWQIPFKAYTKAEEQLLFGDGFRPDIIVSLDPFESGVAGLYLAHTFNRPLQVHVLQDFLKESFVEKDKGNVWRRRIAGYVLKRSTGVRAGTVAIQQMLEKKYRNLSDMRLLPQFQNFSGLAGATPAFDVHEKYKGFVFVALAFGKLTADSHLHETFSALNSVLHNPRIGLVVIGNGPAKKLFEKKVELLGIKRNVVFIPEQNDLVSYLKTADVLVQTDTSPEGDEIVLKAAASGLPMVMYETDMRTDLFKDGESASICPEGDVHAVSENFSAFLNNTALRLQYKNAARYVIETRLEEDETTYFRAFRDSIELSLTEKKDAHT